MPPHRLPRTGMHPLPRLAACAACLYHLVEEVQTARRRRGVRHVLQDGAGMRRMPRPSTSAQAARRDKVQEVEEVEEVVVEEEVEEVHADLRGKERHTLVDMKLTDTRVHLSRGTSWRRRCCSTATICSLKARSSSAHPSPSSVPCHVYHTTPSILKLARSCILGRLHLACCMQHAVLGGGMREDGLVGGCCTTCSRLANTRVTHLLGRDLSCTWPCATCCICGDVLP